MEGQTNFPHIPPLRKMASLSQLPQLSRPARRSPNMSLSRRARVMKPASAQNSPSCASSRAIQQRRRTPAAPITRPATYHAQQVQPSQALNFVAPGNIPSGASAMDSGQRPMTWHPAVDCDSTPPSTEMYSQQYPVYQDANGNVYYGFQGRQYDVNTTEQTSYAFCPNPIYSTVPAHPPMASQQWQQPGTSWFDASTQDGIDGNQLSMESLNLNQMPPSTNFYNHPTNDSSGTSYSQQTCHTSLFPQLTNDAQQHTKEDGNGELVGMGLHDKTTNFEQTSLLLGAGLDEHEKPSPSASPGTKHSSFTSEWSPPEQVPDAIPDEGDETPVTNDIQDFSSPFNHAPYNPYGMTQPTQFLEQNYQPQMYDMSGQSFFFDDPNDVGGSGWYPTEAKSLPMENVAMYPWGWVGQQNGY